MRPVEQRPVRLTAPPTTPPPASGRGGEDHPDAEVRARAWASRTLGMRTRALELAVEYAGEPGVAIPGGAEEIVGIARAFEQFLREG